MSDSAPLLSCRGIVRAFPVGDGELEVLRGVDFDLHEGEFVAIVGASGAGKSTLMHILGLLDKPNAGSVHYRGKDLSTMDPEKAARLRNLEFGFVFQFFHLLPEFSALENVLLPARMAAGGFGWLRKAKEAEARAKELLREFGLEERMGHLPSQLSGGERQRVAIARALINKPAVVFCDEPTGNLDSQTTSEVYALLRRLNREEGQTFLLVTHDEEVAANADRLARMQDGRFVSNQPASSPASLADGAAVAPGLAHLLGEEAADDEAAQAAQSDSLGSEIEAELSQSGSERELPSD